jgi:pyruvate/2-oxoglutarate dehydrogenase complex dihydrolipoamide dehydrogenase (E3) component
LELYGLEKTGVEVDDHGYIRVNERLQTSAPDIWAMGECSGSPHFTHVATDDFRIVRDNLSGGNRTTQGRLVPFCLFIDSELARVGLSEVEAKKRAIAIDWRQFRWRRYAARFLLWKREGS